LEEILIRLKKNIALIVPVFPPYNNSAAIQLFDLAQEFKKQGYKITVIVPSSEISSSYRFETKDGIDILRLKTIKMTDVGNIRRAIAELLMPYFMIFNLRKSNINYIQWDGLIWYSPSIFFGPLIKFLKKHNNVRSYLIVRDIFPDWAVDLELMKRGLIYQFFKQVEKSQYKLADTIGVQTKGNLEYFDKITQRHTNSLEVLHNWLSDTPIEKCSISLASSLLAKKKIAVYAGNMGVAQDLEFFLHLAKKMKSRKDFGFLFVGRGSQKKYLEKKAKHLNLSNVLFVDEINSSEMPGLFQQCHIGIVSLDKRHKQHNIPGKFLSYMGAGLPVLALVNKDNDLIDLVKKYDVGFASSNYSIKEIEILLVIILEKLILGKYQINCKNLSSELFSPQLAVKKISRALFK
jgi:glycosyltransferase involved in cell wall biosynthesis